MQITTSPDISNLLVQVTWDISTNLPVIGLVNKSTGNNLAGVSWAFTAISPSGTYIKNGDINNPDIDGVWSEFVLNNAWPRPFNQIEWSGAPYQFFVTVKDSDGNVFTSTPQYATICRPVGNTQYSKNTFGLASSDVKVSCQQGRVFFQDNTYHTYKGNSGKLIASSLRVMYPVDETGTRPNDFTIGSYSTALVPITYSSNNYQFLQNGIYDYNQDDYTIIRVKYLLLKTFAVWCNVDLLPLRCEIDKLIVQVETGNCSDVVEAQRKLNLITAKFTIVVLGILQPLIGVDVPALIEEIKAIGGFICDCCGAPTGIIPTTAAIIDGYSFSVNKLGGDVDGNFSTNGNNIILNIGDVSYVVAIGNESPQAVTAFSFTPVVSGDGFTKTYYLNIDGQQLGRDVLNNIANDAYSLNLLNSLITIGSSNFKLIVDGGCIFNSTASCDYDFTLHNIPANTTFALITSIKVGIISYPLSFSFNGTNLAALQTYLNGLSLGSCVVTNLGSGNILIAFDNNTNELISLTYMISGTSYQADFARNCTGYVPISANEVVQNIIDYLCGLTDAEVVTSQAYQINYIDANGVIQDVTVNSGTELTSFISSLLSNSLITINYIASLSKLNCENIKINFPNSSNILQSNDYFLGTKNGSCARVYPVEALTAMLQFAAFNPIALNAFCNLVDLCRNGHICTSFDVFTVAVVNHSPSDNEQDIIVTFSNPDSNFTGVTLSYQRIDAGQTSPSIITGILPGASPYTLANKPVGQYIIGLTPIFSDGRSCPPVYMETPPCTGVNAFNATLIDDGAIIEVTYSVTSPKLKVNVVYPNGGQFSQIYTNGDTVDVPVPSGVFGNYVVTIQPVCNETTGFMGVNSAPAIVSIPEPTGIVTATVQSSYNVEAYIANIGGIPGFSLNGNLTRNTTQNGVHTEMVAQTISFSVINPAGGISAFNGVDISVAGGFVTRVEFNSGSTVYQAVGISAGGTDSILLDFYNDN